MRNSKNNRKEPEKSRRVRLSERASSFHGRILTMEPVELRRPKTLPDLLLERSTSLSSDARPPKLTKLLLNVTIQGSLGAVQVVMSPENTVGDLITVSVRQYSKEGLGREEKLIALGSRNFFLCTKTAASKDGQNKTASCSNEAESVTKSSKPWFKFMDFLF
uniref:DUF7054 domain-containing protein n=1 Tax=Gossypium raimondii TaxID=29730 RepID=A0A0D2NQ73_GOSRA|nr:hypothetical protein B456_006G109400 [Gossypium raimondii]